VAWAGITIVLVAGTTYLFSGLSMWVARGSALGRSPRWERTVLAFRSLLDSIQRTIPGGWRRRDGEDVLLGGRAK